MDNKWRDRKDRLDTLHLHLLNDEVMKSLGKSEFDYFNEKSNAIMRALNSDEQAMELSPQDFE